MEIFGHCDSQFTCLEGMQTGPHLKLPYGHFGNKFFFVLCLQWQQSITYGQSVSVVCKLPIFITRDGYAHKAWIITKD